MIPMADCINHSHVRSTYELFNIDKHLNDKIDFKYLNNKMLMNNFSTMFNHKNI